MFRGMAWWRRVVAEPLPPGPGPAEVPVAPVLVGRADDVAAVQAAVAGGAQLVVIAAEAGTGTSALALRVAGEVRDSFPDAQLFAALRGASADPVPPEVVLSRFLRVLGCPADELRGDVAELAVRFRSVVADRRVLVVLDDARDAAQVRHLLPGGARSLVVVTSRRLLSDLLGAWVLPLGGLEPGAALEVLAGVAGPGRVPADQVAARRLVQACAGSPLAARVAGGWLRSGPASVLVDRLGGAVSADRVVGAVCAGLGPGERLVLRRVGGFPGTSFGLGAAAARCGLDEHVVAEVLERLVEVSLVESSAPERFGMHDLLRSVAGDLAEDGAEGVECLRRHLQWLTVRARPGQWWALEQENVLAAVSASVRAGLAEQGRALVVAVHPLADGPGCRLRLWQAAVVVARALGDESFRIRALRWVSHSYGVAGRPGLELAVASEALAAAEALGSDVREVALAAWRVGDAWRAQGRFDEAQVALVRALELLGGLGAVADEVEVRLALGSAYVGSGRAELAVPVLQRVVELVPDGAERGWALLGLAVASRSRELVEEALGVAERAGDAALRGDCLLERGRLSEGRGAYEHAERDYRAMLVVLPGGPGVGRAHAALGDLAVRRGRPEVALVEYDAAAAEFGRLGLRGPLAQVLARRAEVA